MPTYEFSCSRCGRFDAVFSLAAVPDATACACGTSARRAMTAPHLGRGSSGAMRLLDATAATAERPAVVGSIPSGGARTATSTNPLHAKLPRP